MKRPDVKAYFGKAATSYFPPIRATRRAIIPVLLCLLLLGPQTVFLVGYGWKVVTEGKDSDTHEALSGISARIVDRSIPSREAIQDFDWTGTWVVRFVRTSVIAENVQMEILQSGDRITGTYSYKNGRLQGVATYAGKEFVYPYRIEGEFAQDDAKGVFNFTSTFGSDYATPGLDEFGGIMEIRYVRENATWVEDWRVWSVYGKRSADRVTLRTDREPTHEGYAMYEQGEAVTVSGQVFHRNQPHPPDDLKMALELEVLDPSRPLKGVMTFSTDESGRYSVMPFAGWKTGMYKIHVKAKLTIDSGVFHVENETTIQVISAQEVTDMWPQLEKITRLYKEQIPEGPIRTNPEYRSAKNRWSEGLYGDYENLFIAGTKGDPAGDFACGGYQGQVLRFFDKLRFHKDPEVRALLRGLDYGPVARGLYILGGHHAVVLYPMGTDWHSIYSVRYTGQWAKVFDPWPTQKPEVCFVSDFVGGWGFARPDPYYVEGTHPENDVFSGYPFTGGAIYVNWDAGGLSPPKSTATPKTSVLVKCPVDVLLTDSQGKRVGMLPNGTLVQEFPAYAYRFAENNETVGWYFGLPEGVCRAVITGRASGTFQLLIGGDAAGGKWLDYGNQSITKNAQAKITIGTSDHQPPLSLADGRTIAPTVYTPSATTTTSRPETTVVTPKSSEVTTTTGETTATTSKRPETTSAASTTLLLAICIVGVPTIGAVLLIKRGRARKAAPATGYPRRPPPPPPYPTTPTPPPLPLAYPTPPPPPPPPEAVAPRPPFCASCGRPTTYIQQYQRYYCYYCQRYA